MQAHLANGAQKIIIFLQYLVDVRMYDFKGVYGKATLFIIVFFHTGLNELKL